MYLKGNDLALTYYFIAIGEFCLYYERSKDYDLLKKAMEDLNNAIEFLDKIHYNFIMESIIQLYLKIIDKTNKIEKLKKLAQDRLDRLCKEFNCYNFFISR